MIKLLVVSGTVLSVVLGASGSLEAAPILDGIAAGQLASPIESQDLIPAGIFLCLLLVLAAEWALGQWEPVSDRAVILTDDDLGDEDLGL